jgi:hypothetical protein
MATIYQEGFSISSPPLFKGFDYCFWRTRMIVFLNSINVDFVDILKNDFDLKRKYFDFLNTKLFHIILSALDDVVLSKVITNKNPKEIWSCLEFLYEGTNGDNKPQNDDMEECSTNGMMDDERCLMGLGHQEVSSSQSKNYFTFDELLDAFHDLHDEFEKMISKNNALKNQIVFLSKQNEVLNNQSSFKNDCKNCVDFQEENNFLKDRVEMFDYENEVLKERI